eukprot:TRINITY_DN2205_c0_g1_i1.p1 TRINITY_DN2205_c0_g1~~TRINITY_DN2205_c0_g1_i1.p1  ORF type:complete len:222 (+),score=46.11 TRINITY_DN2205_c0_g1_i1:55-720(+)
MNTSTIPYHPLRKARLAMNRVTYARLDTEVAVLVEMIDEMKEEEVQEVIDVLLSRAVHSDKELWGKVTGGVLQGVKDPRLVRRVLHNKCEINFNMYQQQDVTVSDGLVKYMAALLRNNVMSSKIIHTCLITLLFGTSVDKSSTPTPLSIQLACSLLSLTADLLDPTRAHYYIRRLDQLQPHYTSPAIHYIQEIMSLHENNWVPFPSRALGYNVLRQTGYEV